MSGGSYDYVYLKIGEFTDCLRTNDDPRRIAFKKLLESIAVAAHDIEWVDSGDCEEGYEHKAIDAVFAFLKAEASTIYKAAAFDKIKTVVMAATQQDGGVGNA